ncbi:MAG: VCBS repeat-containing protein [Akkermansiaceae bacterium]
MDLNGDGKLDILSGSYSRMGAATMAGLFHVIYGSEDGFQKAQSLAGTDKNPLIIPIVEGKDRITKAICTRPTAVDWDHDGDLDLVVGNFEGTFYLFRGKGKGTFAPSPELMTCEGRELRVSGAHSDPFAVDWDGDGDLDLVSGSAQGGVEWSENVAGKGKEPELRLFKRLLKAAGHGIAAKDEPSSSTRVWVDDVNGDGKLDLLVGDNAIINHPAKGLSEAEMLEKKKEWQEKIDAVMAEMSKAPAAEDRRPPADLSKKYQELYRSRDEFMTEERTGYVWLYLRK